MATIVRYMSSISASDRSVGARRSPHPKAGATRGQLAGHVPSRASFYDTNSLATPLERAVFGETAELITARIEAACDAGQGVSEPIKQ
jgi:hypothetical protein